MAKQQIQQAGAGQINVSGGLDARSVPSLLRDSRRWFAGSGDIVVDLSQVERADSAGVALLLDWWRQSRDKSISISYKDAPSQMLDIIQFCALEDVLPLA